MRAMAKARARCSAGRSTRCSAVAVGVRRRRRPLGPRPFRDGRGPSRYFNRRPNPLPPRIPERTEIMAIHGPRGWTLCARERGCVGGPGRYRAGPASSGSTGPTAGGRPRRFAHAQRRGMGLDGPRPARSGSARRRRVLPTLGSRLARRRGRGGPAAFRLVGLFRRRRRVRRGCAAPAGTTCAPRGPLPRVRCKSVGRRGVNPLAVT